MVVEGIEFSERSSPVDGAVQVDLVSRVSRRDVRKATRAENRKYMRGIFKTSDSEASVGNRKRRTMHP